MMSCRHASKTASERANRTLRKDVPCNEDCHFGLWRPVAAVFICGDEQQCRDAAKPTRNVRTLQAFCRPAPENTA